ncbi:MAG: adenylate/guanylate cyclase domain-containing protein [Solirubrobacterales bacterium]|nr:adenylate/guanylate cyclase domain-containing protein [Solirubrobacterales bacterium]
MSARHLPQRGRGLRTVALLAVAVSAAGLCVLADRANLLRPVELASVDERFRLRGAHAPDEPVAVVAIDEDSLRRLHQRWPLPRGRHADAIDALRRAGAQAIVYDVQFTEPSDDPAQDDRLVAAVDRADRVVLATTEVTTGGGTLVLGGDDVVREVGARTGHGYVRDDPDGTLRRMSYSFDGLPTLAVAAAEAATGRRVDPARFDGTDALIDYAGPPGTVPTYAFADLLDGAVPAGALRGRIVVVGVSVANVQDVHLTPFTSDDLMPGAEVQANAVATMLRDLPLRTLPRWLDAVLVAALAALLPLAALRLRRPWPIAAAGAAVAVAWLGLAVAAFAAGRVVPVAHPLLGLVVGGMGTVGVLGLLAGVERERARDAFARFVPRAVVDDVLAESGGGLRLGGVRREGTVLFADLRGFTPFAEGRDPEDVLAVLNHYLGEMAGAVLDHGGALIGYLGDGVIAVFGAPLPQEDHADRALAAARSMAGERLARANAWLAERGGGPGFAIGVGLNSGPVMSGTVGSAERMEYAALGDTTNVASRVEELTKDVPHAVLLTGATRAALRRPAGDLVLVGERPVRGRRDAIELWTVGDGAAPERAAPVAEATRRD